MDELRNMHSKANSLEGVKEKYRKAIIDNYAEKLMQLDNLENIRNDDIQNLIMSFERTQYQNAYDNSLGSNDRWGIVRQKNFFGLSAEFLPKNDRNNMLYLKLDSGRFQMQKFPNINKRFFPNTLNISDILKRSENEQFTEIEEFYNMNNREVFQKYGIMAYCDNGQANLIANCVILDSLLKEKYSEVIDIFCYSPNGYVTKIVLEDGTEINANSRDSYDSQAGEKGVTIKKAGREARVDFKAISIGKNAEVLTDINELEVEDVVYSGDSELILQLQKAMEEQFKSQIRQHQEQNDVIPKTENYHEKYSEIAGVLLDRAGVYSYDETYDLDGLSISCINEGSSVCIKSDLLGIMLLADSKTCTFKDFQDLIKIDYHSNEEQAISMEKYLSILEQTTEKLREFVKKIEELARYEKINEQNPEVTNGLLLTKIAGAGIKESDVQNVQKTLINVVEKPKTKQSFDEKEINEDEGK